MTQGKYANVNGLNLYYEIHGSGKPLILLHGGFGSIEMFGEVLQMLARGRQVIAVDLQAHGRTADIDQPLSYEGMADDIFALIKQFAFARADVMGYSLGGGVALQTAIRHPEVVRNLVVVSTPCKRDGWYPQVRAGMEAARAEEMVGSPMHADYVRSAPRPEDWPVLVAKMRSLLTSEYDWSPAVAKLKLPTLIVIGDADSVRTAHAVEFFQLLGGGKRDAGWDGSGMTSAQLAILPATSHYTIFTSPLLASTAITFLDSPMPQA